MRSKELADLAGVTVRTLRHYHQMGLLPEPPRADNGYRTYGALDLARVLRIKRLASLGMSLQQVKRALDAESRVSPALPFAGGPSPAERADAQGASQDGGASFSPALAPEPGFAEVLAALDADLAARIERLQEQRRVIAELRERSIDPDVPPAYGPHIARLREAGASSRVVEAELSGLLLVDRLLESESDEAAAIGQFFALLGESDAVERYAELNESLYRVPADASDAVLARLADELVAFMVPLLESGCAQYGWDLSQESIEAMAASSALADACASGTPHVSSSGVSSESAACKTGGPHCHDADASGLFRTVESERARAIFDMYDHEALNEAQRKVSELVVEGVLERLMKKG